MKFKCCLVRRKLAGTSRTEELPDRVLRHIERCEDCRKEAQAYSRMSALMRDCGSEVEASCLTWDRLKGELVSPDVRRPVLRLKPSLAAAGVTAVIVITAGLLSIKHQPASNTLPKPLESASVRNKISDPKALQPETVKKSDKEPVVVVARESVPPERLAEKDTAIIRNIPVRKTTKSGSDKMANYRPDPVNYKKYRPLDNGTVAVNKDRNPEVAKTTQPGVIAINAPDDKEESNTPPAALISAEEHVINIVGTAPETNDDIYCVIEQIEPQYEVRPVRL